MKRLINLIVAGDCLSTQCAKMKKRSRKDVRLLQVTRTQNQIHYMLSDIESDPLTAIGSIFSQVCDQWAKSLATMRSQSTLQETNISHPGKRKIIYKSALVNDMLVSWSVYKLAQLPYHAGPVNVNIQSGLKWCEFTHPGPNSLQKESYNLSSPRLFYL